MERSVDFLRMNSSQNFGANPWKDGDTDTHRAALHKKVAQQARDTKTGAGTLIVS